MANPAPLKVGDHVKYSGPGLWNGIEGRIQAIQGSNCLVVPEQLAGQMVPLAGCSRTGQKPTPDPQPRKDSDNNPIQRSPLSPDA